METQSEKNKRIAKNTLLLYFRMFVVMAVSLYTSRLVLQALGVVDYGIYNVVGGLVSLCSVFSAAISSAISRFLTVELGRGHQTRLQQVFSVSLSILVVLSVLIVIIAEPVGLWFVAHKMIIPPERLSAAYWVFQLSLLTFIVNLLAVPYNASIISHEKMGVFAYISIVEVAIRFFLVVVLYYINYDKLIVYGLLTVFTSLTIVGIYVHYCHRHFSESKYIFVKDRILFKEIFSLAGWNFIGATASVIRDQGGNILMNIFGGPVVNAARGISMQVNHAVVQFSNNFMTAMNPQIIKSHATSDNNYLFSLLNRGSRFSYYLLLTLSLPLLICTYYVLNIWLGIVPEYAVVFVRLALLGTMIDSLTSTLTTGILATGKVKYYQITVGGLLLLNIPTSYVFLKIGMTPVVVMWVSIGISSICMILRILFANRLLGMNIYAYLKEVVLNCSLVSLLSIILPVFLEIKLGCDNFYEFIYVTLGCVTCSCICVLFVGCKKNERIFVIEKSKTVLKKIYEKNH